MMKATAIKVVEVLLGDVTTDQRKEEIAAKFQSIGKPIEVIDLERLSERELAAIYGHYIEGYSYRELAAHYNVTPGRVRQIAMSGLYKMRVRAIQHDISDVGQDISIRERPSKSYYEPGIPPVSRR